MGDITDTFKDKYYNNETRTKDIQNAKVDIDNIGLTQWQTPFNQKQLQILYKTLANIPNIGMQYNDIYTAQSKETASQVLKKLFGIEQTFSDITLSDEDFTKLINILSVVSRSTNITTLYTDMCKVFKKGFWLLEQGYVYFIIQDNLSLIKALVNFGLLYQSMGTHMYIIHIPDEIDLEQQKLWWIPHTTKIPEWADNFYYPNYTKQLTTKNIPIKIQPEWIYFVY